MTKLHAVLCVIIALATSEATTSKIKVPDTPATLTTAVDSATSLFTRFTPPVSDGGAEITAYKGMFTIYNIIRVPLKVIHTITLIKLNGIRNLASEKFRAFRPV